MATLVFDIETSRQPVEQFDEVQQEYLFREATKLPEDQQAAKREEIARLFSLWPLTGQVVCIAMLNAESQRGQVLFHGVAMKPGKPTAFGRVNGKPFFGMPGYPSSCLTNAYLLLVPSLRDEQLTVTNFTGHPSLTLRAGFVEVAEARSDWAPDPAHPLPTFTPPRRVPHGITLLGRLFDDGLLGRVGVALERQFNVSGERPAMAK